MTSISLFLLGLVGAFGVIMYALQALCREQDALAREQEARWDEMAQKRKQAKRHE